MNIIKGVEAAKIVQNSELHTKKYKSKLTLVWCSLLLAIELSWCQQAAQLVVKVIPNGIPNELRAKCLDKNVITQMHIYPINGVDTIPLAQIGDTFDENHPHIRKFSLSSNFNEYNLEIVRKEFQKAFRSVTISNPPLLQQTLLVPLVPDTCLFVFRCSPPDIQVGVHRNCSDELGFHVDASGRAQLVFWKDTSLSFYFCARQNPPDPIKIRDIFQMNQLHKRECKIGDGNPYIILLWKSDPQIDRSHL